MYTAFYGLREKPFALSPDPRFLYLAGSHREALAHLLYGIEQGEGFISVTGEVGTGKTTLCRTLLERLDGDTELAFLFNPSRTALELLQSICAEFDLPAEGLTRRSLMTQLDAFLVEQKRQGRRVLLIIDEAQTLSENTLEQVRLLSNLETSREKLIQILLLGQPELDRKLDDRGLRQLRQRISVRWKLEPLGSRETHAYVRHRLSVAAGVPKDLFSESALREVHRRTGGVPRLVNQLCDRALLAGYAVRAAQIRPALVRAAAREIPDARRGRKRGEGPRSIVRPWMLLAASVALVGLALLAGLQVGRHGLSNAVRFNRSGDSALARAASSGARDARATATPPAVGENAAWISIGGDERSPLARGIGFVTPEDLGASSAQRAASIANVADATDSGRETTNRMISAAASLAIPAHPVPEVTALAPGLFARLLAKRNSQLAMVQSRRAVLEGFGRAVPALASAPRNVNALQSGIESRGLIATRFEGGSIDLLRRLDHPVLLPISPIPTLEKAGIYATIDNADDNTEYRWLAITGFKDDRARVDGLISNRSVTVPIDELTAHWLETGIIVWERFDPIPSLLQQGEEGRGVLWLQRALAELRFYEGSASGIFDGNTVAALTRFQRKRGLVADGIAGPLTQIALYGQLDRYPVPRLSRDDPSPVLPSSTPAPSRADAADSAGDRG
jgi:general secretion pathway protein A